MGHLLKNKAVPIKQLQDGDLWAGKGWVLITLHIPDSVIVFYIDLYSWSVVVETRKDTAQLMVKTF